MKVVTIKEGQKVDPLKPGEVTCVQVADKDGIVYSTVIYKVFKTNWPIMAIALHEGAWLVSAIGADENGKPQSLPIVGTPIYDKKEAIMLGETIMPHYLKLYEAFLQKKEVPEAPQENVDPKLDRYGFPVDSKEEVGH